MSENNDNIIFDLLANVIALNMFIGLKFGEEGQQTLAALEEKITEQLLSSTESQDEQGED